MNKSNLMKLSNFLMVNNVPFKMDYFRQPVEEGVYHHQNNEMWCLTLDEVEAGLSACGTVGCALGWAPFIIPPKKSCVIEESEQFAQFTPKRKINFIEYEKHAFGLNQLEFSSTFSGAWSHVDNTREGAAYRLAMLAERGQIFLVRDLRMYLEPFAEYIKGRDLWIANWKQG